MMWRDCGPCYNTTHRGFVAGSGEQGGFRKLVEGRAQAVLVPAPWIAAEVEHD